MKKGLSSTFKFFILILLASTALLFARSGDPEVSDTIPNHAEVHDQSDSVEHTEASSHAHNEAQLEEHQEEHKGEHHSNMFPLLFIILALVVGAGTRHFMKKSPLPYTVTLLIIGLAAGAIDRFGGFQIWNLGLFNLDMDFMHQSLIWAAQIDPHLILYIFLPTLIFEAAFAMDVHTFKKTAGNAALMAIPGIILALLLTAAIVMGLKAAGMGLQAWTWPVALLFGTVISATDPVAVVALLKELGASKKLGTLIEGESLLNDGTAIVIFSVLLITVTGAESSTGPVAEFLRVAIGGTLVGLIFGWITIRWVGRVFNDALIEISLIVAAAYLTFFVAEHFFHVSGVLGLVALGLMIGGIGRTHISPEVGHFLHEFWELAAFIANTLIFLIVGVLIAERTMFTGMDVVRLLIIYVGIHVVRALVILLFYPIMKRSGYGLPRKEAMVLWYGALRGAIGLALALMVAGEASIDQGIRDDFLFYTAGIVTLTLLINATTIKYVVNGLGLTKIAPAKALMMTQARSLLRKEAEASLDDLQKNRYIKRAKWDQVREYLPEDFTQEANEEMHLDSRTAEIRRRLLAQEKSTYWELFNKGLLGASGVRRLTDAINVIMDEEGLVSLSHRKDLEQEWKTPKILGKMQNMPLIGKISSRMFFDRLSTSYDSASAFVFAQEESLELLKKLSGGAGNNEEGVNPESVEHIEDEINENKIQGNTFLRMLRNYYPEIYSAIATRQAARSMLNHERQTVKGLLGKGLIDSGEAEKITSGIEERMKILMEAPPMLEGPGAMEIIGEIPWLKGIEPATLNRIVTSFKDRVYAVKEHLIKENSKEGGLFILARGKVKISIDGVDLDVVGAGSVLGEMSLLTGQPRTATVITVTPVSVLWISTSKIKSIMRDDPLLENKLWEFASMRFAMNLLGSSKPYNQWHQKEFSLWLNAGEILEPEKDQLVDLKDKIGILVAGVATSSSDGSTILAPATLDSGSYTFSEDSRIYLRKKS